MLSETTGQSSTVAYAQPSTTSFAYDALNRQTQEIDAYGVAGVHRMTSMVYDAAANVVQSYDALNHVTTYTYNALNQQITEQTPAGDTATTVYDANGNVLAQIDQLGHATSYSYDALNRQITETDGDGDTTTYAYDAASNQISVTDADNNTTTMVFDALNRQISETDPLNHTSTAVYDAASNLISTTDRDGRLETFSYDALNRKTGETWIVSGSTTNVQTFTYDAASNQLTAADYNGVYTMTYDALNRMTSDQEPFGQALTYSYDAASNQIQVQDSQGGTTTSVYNALNELTTREFGGTGQTPLREDLTYTALGQIATETRYTDLAGTQVAGTSSYVYDTDGRLTDLTQTYANGSVLASYVYNYNQASLLTSEVDDGVTTSYSYDNANQLIQSGAATYGYDATGNRTNTGYQTGTDNQLLSDGTYSYTYDNEGNLETKQAGNDITTYSYNNQNELTSVIETVGGTLTMQATYVYDVFGNRLEADDYKGSVTTITRSAYDGSNAWEDLNGSNVLQMRYFYLDGQNQMLARVDSSGNLAWYGTDHLGSVRIVLNAAGTMVLDQITYDAYGNIISESSPGNRGNYGYAGFRIDMATGEDEAGRRWYAPWIGVWTSEDPIQFAGGNPNLYGYVNNDPTNYTDPSGRTAESTFEGFPEKKLEQLKKSIDTAFSALERAYTDISGLYNKYIAYRSSLSIFSLIFEPYYKCWYNSLEGPDKTVFDNLASYFPPIKESDHWFVGVYLNISLTYKYVNEHSIPYYYQESAPFYRSGTEAGTSNKLTGSITIYRLFFNAIDRPGQNPLEELSRRIVHEWTHVGASTHDDLGYMNDPLDPSKGYFGGSRFTEGRWLPQLIPRVLENADTYAGYIYKYYIRSSGGK